MALPLLLLPLASVLAVTAVAPPAAGATGTLTWLRQTTPNPDYRFNLNNLMAIGSELSCPATGTCFAVQSYQGQSNANCTNNNNNGNGNECQQPFFMSEAGGTWTQATPSDYSSWGFSTTNDGALESVSCASTTDCTAVGFSGDPPQPVAIHYDGTSWTPTQTPPIPAGAVAAEMIGLDCPVVNSCLAVGAYLDNTGTPQFLAEQWDGSGWTQQTNGLGTSSAGSFLTQVTCAVDTTSCLVNGYTNTNNNNGNGPGTPVAYDEETGVYSPETFPTTLPDPTNPSQQDAIQTLGSSCPSTTQCFVDGILSGNGNGPQAGFILEGDQSGGTWTWSTSQVTTGPAGSIIALLGGLTCASSTWCIATGASVSQVPNENEGVISSMTWIWTPGSGWQLTPTASNNGSPDNTIILSDSCSAVDSCEGYGFTSATGPFNFNGNGPSFVSFAAQLTQPNATLSTAVSNTEAGAQNVQYSFTFTTWQLGTVGSLTFTVPSGTQGTPSVVEAFGVGPGTASYSSGVLTYTLNTPQVIPAGVPILIVFGGIQNSSTYGSMTPVATTLDTTVPTPNVIDTAISSDAIDLGASGTGATVAVPESLTFVNNAPSVSLLPIPDGPQVSQDINLQVTTNAGQGYSLTATSTPIALPSSVSLAQASTTGSNFATDQIGARVGYQPGGGQGNFNGPLNNNNQYYGLPTDNTTQLPVMGRSAPTGNTPDAVNLNESVAVDSAQATGTYTGTITFTASPSY